jgi:hypothetical protein
MSARKWRMFLYLSRVGCKDIRRSSSDTFSLLYHPKCASQRARARDKDLQNNCLQGAVFENCKRSWRLESSARSVSDVRSRDSCASMRLLAQMRGRQRRNPKTLCVWYCPASNVDLADAFDVQQYSSDKRERFVVTISLRRTDVRVLQGLNTLLGRAYLQVGIEQQSGVAERYAENINGCSRPAREALHQQPLLYCGCRYRSPNAAASSMPAGLTPAGVSVNSSEGADRQHVKHVAASKPWSK